MAGEEERRTGGEGEGGRRRLERGTSLTPIALAHSIFGSERYGPWMDLHSDAYEGATGIYSLIQVLADELDESIEKHGGWEAHDWYLTCDEVAGRLFAYPARVVSLSQLGNF